MTLVQGQRYRAKIRLGMFESIVGNDTVREKLEEAGFVAVAVSGSGRDRVAEGEWGGVTQDAGLPDHVTSVEAL